MIYLKTVKQFCKEYWKIENYDQAMTDTTQTWHCHHRHEIDWALPMEELIAIGRYYDVHYSELIFLTPAEHKRLHMKGNTWNNGKHHTEEWKQKRSDAMKGENNPNYGKEGTFKGKHHTEECKQKLSAIKKGENNPNYKYHITEEELYNLYIVQGFTQQDIASMYGCSQRCIQLKLKKYNISKSKS